MARWKSKAKPVTLEDMPAGIAWYPGQRVDDAVWEERMSWLRSHGLVSEFFELVGSYFRAKSYPARRNRSYWESWNTLREGWGLPRVEPPDVGEEDDFGWS